MPFRSHRIFDGRVGSKDAVHPRQLEEDREPFLESRYRQITVPTDELERADERAQTPGIHEAYVSEVDDDPVMTPIDEIADRTLELDARATVDAVFVDDEHVGTRDFELGGLQWSLASLR